MTINDREWKFLAEQTGLSLPFNDLYFRYLRSLGFTGTLQDMIGASGFGLTPSKFNENNELILNPGNPFNNTDGYIPYQGAAVSVVSGKLRVINTENNFGYAAVSFPTIVGVSYTVRVLSDPPQDPGFHVGFASTEPDIYGYGVNLAADDEPFNFMATHATAYIAAKAENNVLNGYRDFIYISAKEEE